MKIKHFIYLAIALLLGYLIFNRITKNGETGPADTKGAKDKSAKPTAVLVNGLVIKSQNFTNSITVSGSIEANEQVQLRSEISGIVQTINFAEGSFVNKGALLLKIDDRELQAQLLQAKTKQTLAAENEARAAKLLKAEALSVEEYQNTKAELKLLQAQTQLVKAQLSKTQIRAPFAGMIGLRNISNGAYLTPTTDIANLQSTNIVKITFSVPQKYAQRVKNGLKITFTVSGTDKIFTAKIYATEPSINTTTRTLILKAKADNAKGYLLPGTFANIVLPLQNISNAILIPSQSIVPVLNGKQVFISVNGNAKSVMVQSDIRTNENVLITNGLKVGDTLLTTGTMSLKNDMPVKVNLQQTP
ncbi:MAG: efflux RND transporter periplasmic adaptor subunit [Sphingobacteriales bacterium]|nr:MAG: efflux RND transporter periplasmic adaptor subunit [Sphingobacteriales bacterium]